MMYSSCKQFLTVFHCRCHDGLTEHSNVSITVNSSHLNPVCGVEQQTNKSGVTTLLVTAWNQLSIIVRVRVMNQPSCDIAIDITAVCNGIPGDKDCSRGLNRCLYILRWGTGTCAEMFCTHTFYTSC